MKIHSLISPLIALLVSVAQPSARAAVFSDDFNTSSAQWSDYFAESGQDSPKVNYTWVESGGVGDSGAVSVSGSPETAYYKNSIEGFPEKGGYTISAFFRLKSTDTGASANLGFATGLIASPSDLMGSNSGTNTYLTLQAQINSTAAGNDTEYQFSFRSRSGSDNHVVSTADDPFTVTDGNWYQFITNYQFDAGLKTFTATAQLWDYGASGTLLNPVLIASFTSDAIANASFATDTEVYAAIKAARPAYGGVTHLDNFELAAIPEPGATALMTLAFLLIAGGRITRLRPKRAVA